MSGFYSELETTVCEGETPGMWSRSPLRFISITPSPQSHR